MSAYSARELIKILQDHGWYEIRQIGSHKQFRHKNRPNKITVPVTQIKKNIEMNILKQAGLRHLVKRRNMKPQPRAAPQYQPIKTVVTQPSETAKNIKENQGVEERKENIMPTLGEIARVNITPPVEKPKLSHREMIVEFLTAMPLSGFNTPASTLCNKIKRHFDSDVEVASLMAMISAMVKKGTLERENTQTPQIYNFRLTSQSVATISTPPPWAFSFGGYRVFAEVRK